MIRPSADNSQLLCDAINAHSEAAKKVEEFRSTNSKALTRADEALLELSYKLHKEAFEILFKVGRL